MATPAAVAARHEPDDGFARAAPTPDADGAWDAACHVSISRMPDARRGVVPTATPQGSGKAKDDLTLRPFERALGVLASSSLLPSTSEHPLATVASASPVLRVSWAALHPAVHPSAAGVPPSRLERKCWQIESMAALVVMLAPPRGACRIVDFCGGSGALALPLAALLPRATVTIVDVNAYALAIAERRAARAGLTNLRTGRGDVDDWRDKEFDVGVALHACGEAADLAMEACVAARARFVICPCCVGKMKNSRHNNVTFRSTGTNANRVAYPRSAQFAETLGTSANSPANCSANCSTLYDALATAADFSDEVSPHSHGDRLAYARRPPSLYGR